MVINITKLRKYYLYKKYKNFFVQNDIVIFYNSLDNNNVNKVELQLKLDNIMFLSCKNTLLKKVLSNNNIFCNLIKTPIKLMGLRGITQQTTEEFEHCLDFFKKLKTLNYCIGVLYKKNKKTYFLLPINIDIIYYYYNLQYFFNDFIKKCILPQYCSIFYKILLYCIYNYISLKYISIFFYYKINRINNLQTIKASIAQ